MLKKDQLLKDSNFRKVLLEEILIYKDFTNKYDFNNRLAIALITGGYCNKNIRGINIGVRPIKRYDNILYYQLAINERLSSIWRYTNFSITPDLIDEWIEEMNN